MGKTIEWIARVCTVLAVLSALCIPGGLLAYLWGAVGVGDRMALTGLIAGVTFALLSLGGFFLADELDT